MNDLDALLAATEPEPVTSVSTATPRRCKRHVWSNWSDSVSSPDSCLRCGTVKDEARSRRGRSSRRLGNDQERRAEKRYGWEKIGERGEKPTSADGCSRSSRRPAAGRPRPCSGACSPGWTPRLLRWALTRPGITSWGDVIGHLLTGRDALALDADQRADEWQAVKRGDAPARLGDVLGTITASVAVEP